jgi:predicted MFS family arabinose efflux permease
MHLVYLLQLDTPLSSPRLTELQIFQGLAPSVVAGLSDTFGRRPSYIFCFVVYIVINIGLGIQNSYAALLVLRCFQSTGIAGTVALSNAVVADIITSAERGKYVAWSSLGGALAPSLSPIIGGALSETLGYHSVFWFLVISGGAFFIPFLLFFPETCRSVVGDGSVPPPKWNKSLSNHLDERRRKKAGEQIDYSERDRLAKQRGVHVPNPITATLVMIMEIETAILLLFMGIVYAGTYAIFGGIPSQFNAIYGFNNIELGLVYLSIGIGGVTTALTQGKLLDWNYARHAKRHGFSVSKTRQQDLINFPIERARLEISVPLMFLCSLFIIAYGWLLKFEVHVAAPIVVLFFLGYLILACFNALSVLIVDLNPKSPGTATAAMNLVRCLLGAGATAVVLPMLNAMGNGWTFTFVGLVYIAIIPLLFALIRWGPKWRRQRKEKEEREEAEKEAQ